MSTNDSCKISIEYKFLFDYFCHKVKSCIFCSLLLGLTKKKKTYINVHVAHIANQLKKFSCQNHLFIQYFIYFFYKILKNEKKKCLHSTLDLCI